MPYSILSSDEGKIARYGKLRFNEALKLIGLVLYMVVFLFLLIVSFLSDKFENIQRDTTITQ